MLNILNVIGAILILSFLVIIHELGHYWAAKKNGIKVPEFGVGFPPRLFKFKRWGTEFSINLIPFGGYVRLHGEDSHDPKLRTDKSSFASKTPWQKIEVLIAGVFMNFLVFWVLMSVALWSGVEPVMTNQEDFRKAVLDGYYKLRPEIVVQSSEDSRIKAGDVFLEVNGKADLSLNQVLDLYKGDLPISSLEVRTDSEFKELEISTPFKSDSLQFYPLTSVPVYKVTTVDNDSLFAGNLLVGDLLYAVNGSPLFEVNSFFESVNRVVSNQGASVILLDVVRGAELVNLEIPFERASYFVDEVLPDSVAEEGGLLKGDRIVAVDGLILGLGESIPDFLKSKGVEKVVFTVDREGKEIDLLLSPDEDGLVGVYLTSEIKLSNLGVDFVASSKYGSVIKVKDYRVAWYLAPIAALTEGYKIAEATVIGFTKTVFGIVTNFKVSEEVGGPVQVAKLSYQFVDKGGIDLINFIALISLSLAVINLLPIPALDGGRLVFVIVEALRGKPINQKVEAMIHTFGFLALMGLILIITVFDIIRL